MGDFNEQSGKDNHFIVLRRSGGGETDTEAENVIDTWIQSGLTQKKESHKTTRALETNYVLLSHTYGNAK